MWWLLLLPSALALRTLEPVISGSWLRDTTAVEEGYFSIRLNHFDASNTDTFDMRYYFNPAPNVQNANNLVIFVGGEWEISPGWTAAGLPLEIAEMIGAGVFYTEHRYYGQTRPTNTTNVSDLRWLTIDQAMADLAQFIQIAKSEQFKGGQYSSAKVVLVGCSYAGTMATWMRVNYPHLVDAAFSDSGPLQAQEDFPEYLEVINVALREQGGQECVDSVELAMAQLVASLGTADGAATLSRLFNTCAPLQTTPLDLVTFFWFGITETFAGLVQYATPGDIPAACAALTDTNISSSAVERMARWVTAQSWTQPCVEARYSEQVALHTNLSYDSPKTTMRLWTYQTCVEFGWYQTTTSTDQPFLSSVPLEYFHQMCKDFFSEFFDESLLRQGIERTNIFFGGLDMLPDRVVTVQGGHDPWSPVGPNATHSTLLSPVYVVPQISHCRAIQSTASSETQALADVKRAVLSDIYTWVGEPQHSSSAYKPASAASVLTLAAIIAYLLQ